MGRNVQVCASSRTKSSLERMIKRTRIQQMTVKLKEGFHGHARSLLLSKSLVDIFSQRNALLLYEPLWGNSRNLPKKWVFRLINCNAKGGYNRDFWDNWPLETRIIIFWRIHQIELVWVGELLHLLLILWHINSEICMHLIRHRPVLHKSCYIWTIRNGFCSISELCSCSFGRGPANNCENPL